MNDFERNYWSSYCDFIDLFAPLTYLGISIPLVSPYYVLIHENAINKLSDKALSKSIKTSIKKERDIQSHFEQRLNSYRKKVSQSKGKVVLYDTSLRIPELMLKEHFLPSETMILRQRSKNPKPPHAIPAAPFISYSKVNKKTISEFQTKAIECLNKVNFHPIYGDKKFRNRLVKIIPGIMHQISAAVHFFEKTSVSCLVLGTTNSSDTRSMALAASLKGVPTICLQHGIPMLEFGYLPKVADYLAVYGSYDVEWYSNKGVPLTSLKSMGHPRFDEIFKMNVMDKKAFQTHFKLDPSKKTVLLVIHHEETEIPKAIIQQMKGTCNLIVKQRNGKQRDSEKTVLLQKEFPDVSFADDMHLYNLLHCVDAVISYESTIVLEAMLADKPVFIWKLRSLVPSSTNYYEQLNDYIFQDAGTLVKSVTAALEADFDKQTWERKKTEFLASKYFAQTATSIHQLKALIQSLKA
ncbi:hypothetical protein LF817_01105 [Halobacillus sp. A1]|uniref:hypothetical protein n=1 Tax=Halobacillus sp. A1 TaxID=2880262 RepID=UPI0020A6D725|nr:hypothetical protein [Halobacillus sp. A1]MCP3029929.1 hypothetical protein [Halobacillus sp. A1]